MAQFCQHLYKAPVLVRVASAFFSQPRGVRRYVGAIPSTCVCVLLTTSKWELKHSMWHTPVV